MFFFFTLADGQDEVLRAQQDEAYLNTFITRHQRMIKRCAYWACKRFITESDDEWSIALIAFHEAVKAYDLEKGDFKKFAALVIKRRLQDYLRSESRHTREVSMEPSSMDGDIGEEEEATVLQLEVRRRSAELSEERGQGLESENPGTSPIRDEIDAVQDLLKPYGFSFFDLADCSPKAEKTKQAAAQAVAVLVRDPALFQKMRDTKSLPAKEIIDRAGVNRKILERHRRYIIAAAEIMNGEYPLLKEYMEYIRKALVT